LNYEPPSRHARTNAERANEMAAWLRSDKAFFAAGACHILAWAFLEKHPMEPYLPIGLRRIGQFQVHHVYISDGTWAFDHDGWTREDVLLEVTSKDIAQRLPDAVVERLPLGSSLDSFCTEHNSRLPSQYAFDPWPRAFAYLARFPLSPPEESINPHRLTR
jgi:hypothetical protein